MFSVLINHPNVQFIQNTELGTQGTGEEEITLLSLIAFLSM